ncbi:MAG: metal transporter [Flavobacterium sp.]|uniref:heavy-metal-associated domain-containing protein n=1 Tax=Flavobacterium sp. TaxID=239 RepID=UPI000C4A5BF2|nr:metal transporter [Flavobacterium sp.]MBF04468.1 metal transporter [Flavobacterium sp.]|tara:strand:- start:574 stop:918 length:345 start_codon:yes stop_codon:yes gene_type:complete
MKKIIMLLLVSLLALTSFSQEKKDKNKKVEFAVNGNCEMCKKRIEKAAFSVKGVKSADWHIEHKDLHLIIDENKCSVVDVQKAVAKAGHDAGKVKATAEDYNQLHGCCQYERKE